MHVFIMYVRFLDEAVRNIMGLADGMFLDRGYSIPTVMTTLALNRRAHSRQDQATDQSFIFRAS